MKCSNPIAKIAGLLITGLLATSIGAETLVHEYLLENGLKLLVKEDHRAPVVVSQLWYKVGASYEASGITGISHLLEHMMFKGTERYPAGDFSRTIAANGGRENAFTGRDYTTYFQRIASDRLAISFQLEADRMRNLTLPVEEFNKERQVVIEERRLRTEDRPKSQTFEHFIANAYQNNPYQNPVIGWMDDLKNMDPDDLKVWYRAWYAPNNATLVVVGDVKPQAVLKLAKEYFGPIHRVDVKTVKSQREVKQFGIKRIVVKRPARWPYLIMGYKVPTLRTAEDIAEVYALEVLAALLDGGDSARLPKRLVRGQQVANDAGAGYEVYARLDTLFLLDGTPAQGKTIADLEAALREEVRRLKEEPIPVRELERIKTQVLTDDIYEQDSMFYQAMQLGTLETVGLEWRFIDDYVPRIRAVTSDQVRAVARKYLIDDHLTVAVLDPLPMDKAKTSPPDNRSAAVHGR